MTDDDLFIDTVEDLRRRCVIRASEYDMIQASGLIRRLLIDKHSLADTVRKSWRKRSKHDVPAQFVWLHTYRVYGGRWMAGQEIDPQLSERLLFTLDPRSPKTSELPTTSERRGNCDEFMAFDVTGGHGDTSIKELVLFFAHQMGGVHRDPRQEDLPKFLTTLSDADLAYLTRTVAAVGRIVVRALEPLEGQLFVNRPL